MFEGGGVCQYNILRMTVDVTVCTYSTVKEKLSHLHKRGSKKSQTCMYMLPKAKPCAIQVVVCLLALHH